MLSKQFLCVQFRSKIGLVRCFRVERATSQTTKSQEVGINEPKRFDEATSVPHTSDEHVIGEIFPTEKVVPMVLTNKEPVVLSFNDVPGPKSLKYLSSFRQYLTEVGTHLTAGALTLGLNIGEYCLYKIHRLLFMFVC